MVSDAVLAEGGADTLAGTDEVLAFAQGDGSRDALSALGCAGEALVEAILWVEGWQRAMVAPCLNASR